MTANLSTSTSSLDPSVDEVDEQKKPQASPGLRSAGQSFLLSPLSIILSSLGQIPNMLPSVRSVNLPHDLSRVSEPIRDPFMSIARFDCSASVGVPHPVGSESLPEAVGIEAQALARSAEVLTPRSFGPGLSVAIGEDERGLARSLHPAEEVGDDLAHGDPWVGYDGDSIVRVASMGNFCIGGRMLILHRKVGEEIILTTAAGERVTVRVEEIHRGKTKLAIEAPMSVRVDRLEVDIKRGKGKPCL